MSNYTGGIRNRRTRSLDRLVKQLSKNKELRTRGSNDFHEVGVILLLKENDVKRIEKEIQNLKSKL